MRGTAAFSSRRSARRVPGIGITPSYWASSHARATWPGVASWRSATSRTRSTIAKFCSGAWGGGAGGGGGRGVRACRGPALPGAREGRGRGASVLGRSDPCGLAGGDDLGHRAPGLLDRARPGRRGAAGRGRRPSVQHTAATRRRSPASTCSRRPLRPISMGLPPTATSRPHFVASTASPRRPLIARADQPLVRERAVDVGGVDERHPDVQRSADDGDRALVVALLGVEAQDMPDAAQADGPDGGAAGTECACGDRSHGVQARRRRARARRPARGAGRPLAPDAAPRRPRSSATATSAPAMQNPAPTSNARRTRRSARAAPSPRQSRGVRVGDRARAAPGRARRRRAATCSAARTPGRSARPARPAPRRSSRATSARPMPKHASIPPGSTTATYEPPGATLVRTSRPAVADSHPGDDRRADAEARDEPRRHPRAGEHRSPSSAGTSARPRARRRRAPAAGTASRSRTSRTAPRT